MIFEKLTIQNFMSIKSVTLDLQDRGLVLIKGINHDNPDLNNNGSGKSSMIEALVYALYGRTLRGVKGDDVVHKKPKKNMKIFLDLVDDDGVKYRIARYRKHSVNKNKSLLYRNGVDITPKSEADFNDYVANLLQADYLTFTSSLLYSGESFKFTSATDAEMKSTFDTMLGLNVFSKCQEIAKIRLKVVENDLSSTEWKIDDRKSKIDELTDKITEAEEQKRDYEATLKEQVKKNKATIKELEATLKEQKKDLKKLQTEFQEAEEQRQTAQDELDKCKKSAESLEKLQSELVDIVGDIKKHKQTIKQTEREVESLESDVEKCQKKIEQLNAKTEQVKQKQADLDKEIGQPCPTCGQPMTAESIEPAKREYNGQLVEIQQHITEYESKIQKYQDEICDNQSEIEDCEESITALEDEKAEFEKLIDKFQSIQEKKSAAEEKLEECQDNYYSKKSQVKTKNNEIKQTEERLKDAEEALEDSKSAKNPYDDIIDKYVSDKKKAEVEIKEMSDSIQDKLDEQKCLQFWQQAYSNQGIKSLILDDITPFLNRRVNKYLQKLTSGHIEVKFSTQTTLKSGETREKFSIDIINQDGGSAYIANSAGEKKRIDLCVNLALQDLVASRSNKRMNIAIFDEIFDCMDEVGIERSIELLQDLSSEKSSIFVISHNPHLQSYFTNIITIQKKDGFSTLLEDDAEEITEDDD